MTHSTSDAFDALIVYRDQSVILILLLYFSGMAGMIILHKIAHIWSYSSPHFHAIGLNMERYRVSLRIQAKCGKIRTIITPNMDTFNAVNPGAHKMYAGSSFYFYALAAEASEYLCH